MTTKKCYRIIELIQQAIFSAQLSCLPIASCGDFCSDFFVFSLTLNEDYLPLEKVNDDDSHHKLDGRLWISYLYTFIKLRAKFFEFFINCRGSRLKIQNLTKNGYLDKTNGIQFYGG